MPSKRGQGLSVTEPLRDTIDLEPKAVLRGLLDVAKVALGPTMPEIPDDEAAELLFRLIAVIDRAMPADLKHQDSRLLAARLVAEMLKQ